MVIIGTGMGGGTLAYELRESGIKMLLLERGDFLPSNPKIGVPRRFSRRRDINPKSNGMTRRVARLRRASITSSVATQRFTGRRCHGFGERTLRSSSMKEEFRLRGR